MWEHRGSTFRFYIGTTNIFTLLHGPSKHNPFSCGIYPVLMKLEDAIFKVCNDSTTSLWVRTSEHPLPG